MRKRPIDVCDTVLTSDPAARSHTGGYERTDNACRDACANANPTHHSHLEPRASGLSRPGGGVNQRTILSPVELSAA